MRDLAGQLNFEFVERNSYAALSLSEAVYESKRYALGALVGNAVSEKLRALIVDLNHAHRPVWLDAQIHSTTDLPRLHCRQRRVRAKS